MPLAQLPLHAFKIPQRQFTGEHNALTSQGGGQGHTGGTGDRRLGRAVQCKGGRSLLAELQRPTS